MSPPTEMGEEVLLRDCNDVMEGLFGIVWTARGAMSAAGDPVLDTLYFLSLCVVAGYLGITAGVEGAAAFLLLPFLFISPPSTTSPSWGCSVEGGAA